MPKRKTRFTNKENDAIDVHEIDLPIKKRNSRKNPSGNELLFDGQGVINNPSDKYIYISFFCQYFN